MIEGIRLIRVERRLSAYCKDCKNLQIATEEFYSFDDGVQTTNRIERCAYCNICDSLYRRLKNE